MYISILNDYFFSKKIELIRLGLSLKNNMTFTILSREETITILGPKNNYIEITISTPEEISKRNYKKNLNAYFLFQTDLKREIKRLKSSSTQFDKFTNNIPDIWEKTPEIIKNKYKVLSEEVEKLNKPSDLKILSFDPKNLGKKKKHKRRSKENNIQPHKNKKNKINKLRKDKDVSFMEPKINPPVINSVIPSLEVSEGNNIIMSPSNGSYLVAPFPSLMETDIMDTVDIVLNSTPLDVSYSVWIPPTDVSYSEIPPIPLPDVSYSLIPPTPLMDVSYYVTLPPSQTQFSETDIPMKNSNLTPDPPPGIIVYSDM